MQTRSQTIAELRAQNETMKLMIFGGELALGSSFSSVGFVEQLERKDAQIDALKVKCEYWKECYEMQQKETDIEHQRYLKYLEKHSEVQDELDDLRSRQESKDIVFLNPAADEYIKMIKVQHAEEIKTWSDTLDDHHVHYDILKNKCEDLKKQLVLKEEQMDDKYATISFCEDKFAQLKKKYDDIEERYEVMEQTWISEDDADNIHDEYLESIDGLKMELDDMKCIALVNWSQGKLTWDYDNRKPVAKVGKYHNIEKAVPEDWVALLDTLN